MRSNMGNAAHLSSGYFQNLGISGLSSMVYLEYLRNKIDP
jgi:hypothetical protein